jgi:hypothetical protein
MENKPKRVTTPIFRVSFPNVFQPKLNELSGKTEYSMVMLFDKKADLKPLKELAAATVREKWGDKVPSGLRNPFRDGDVEKAGREGYVNVIFINAKSNQKPGVVDGDCQPIINTEDFYPGCYARATLTAYAYDNKGNRGVAFGLGNVQKVKDGEPFSGRSRAEDDFAPVANTSTAEPVDSIFG